MLSRLKLFRQALSIVALVSAPTLHAATTSFCGAIDLPSLTGNEASQLIAGLDLNRTQRAEPVKRSNCGLYGEAFPICSSCDNELPESSMRVLRPMLGSKPHSDWHAQWHALRNPNLLITPENFKALQEARVVSAQMSLEFFNANYRLGGQLGGENFFFMHRLMIKMVQFELSANGLGCVAPWQNLPPADDSVWPVPKSLVPGSDQAVFAQTIARFQKKIESFKKESNLRKVTLNRLGEMVEPGLHLSLHMLYQTPTLCSKEAEAQGYCDSLGPDRTSPMNKYFWKIHGLVDEILGAWLKANGFDQISTDCGSVSRCYQWKGSWIGKYR